MQEYDDHIWWQDYFRFEPKPTITARISPRDMITILLLPTSYRFSEFFRHLRAERFQLNNLDQITGEIFIVELFIGMILLLHCTS